MQQLVKHTFLHLLMFPKFINQRKSSSKKLTLCITTIYNLSCNFFKCISKHHMSTLVVKSTKFGFYKDILKLNKHTQSSIKNNTNNSQYWNLLKYELRWKGTSQVPPNRRLGKVLSILNHSRAKLCMPRVVIVKLSSIS